MTTRFRSERISRTLSRLLVISIPMLLLVAVSAPVAYAQSGSAEQSQPIAMHVGDQLQVSSNRQSLQLVEIQGNLSAAKFSSPHRYPAATFNFTSNAQSHYSIKLTFNNSSEYYVTITVNDTSNAQQEKASYYVSSGQLILIIDLDVGSSDLNPSLASASPWSNFTGWTTRFGAAFPLWVKLLYVFLGMQFVAVGYKWIRFENRMREEDSVASRFDRGNQLYLWSEVLCKFLLTAFLVIAVVMGGQLILVSVLKFMFLAQVNMLSLWDLFVLGFAAGITAIAYTLKLCLEKSFDLKPLFQD